MTIAIVIILAAITVLSGGVSIIAENKGDKKAENGLDNAKEVRLDKNAMLVGNIALVFLLIYFVWLIAAAL